MKYELLENDFIEVLDKKLYRIRALKNFNRVEQGELGGYIEKYDNLSQRGNAWVCGNARVYGNAVVCGNARVYGNAEVCDNAVVCGYARVCGNAWVCGNARVYGNAVVCGNARVCGNAEVCGVAEVYGDARVYGNARVCGNALICKRNDLITVSNIGSRNAVTTFFNTDNGIYVKCGCFYGSIEEFEEAVKDVHTGTKHEVIYLKTIELAKIQIKGEV